MNSRHDYSGALVGLVSLLMVACLVTLIAQVAVHAGAGGAGVPVTGGPLAVSSLY